MKMLLNCVRVGQGPTLPGKNRFIENVDELGRGYLHGLGGDVSIGTWYPIRRVRQEMG